MCILLYVYVHKGNCHCKNVEANTVLLVKPNIGWSQNTGTKCASIMIDFSLEKKRKGVKTVGAANCMPPSSTSASKTVNSQLLLCSWSILLSLRPFL